MFFNLPTINFRSSVRTASDNFRRSIQRRSTECAEQVGVIKHIGETKISNLSTAILIQQNVLQLQISVTNIVLKKNSVSKF